MNTTDPLLFSRLIERFFLDRLMNQVHASPRTVAAYRDTFRLVLAFLKHLEDQRHNTIRSRNARLAAIRSFMHFASFQEPSATGVAQRVLAIPMKRFERPLIGYLTKDQVETMLSAPSDATWVGRRDRMMLTVSYNSGARVSELIALRRSDLILDPAASIKIMGKGRKERSVPLWPTTRTRLRSWLREIPPDSHAVLFPNRAGGALSRTSVAERLTLAVKAASRPHPELGQRRVSPHVLRHSIAMRLLQSGVDITVIALWLGHESTATTHQYVEADLAMKARALAALKPPATRPLRYRPTDRTLQFLNSL
jgi:integrase/recombinase XerD